MIAVCARAVCIGNGLGRIKLTALPTSKAQRPLVVLGFKRETMIKDVMVWLDGSLADEVRLEAAAGIARHFESQVVALVFNPMPLPGPIEGGSGAAVNAELLEKARGAGDKTEAKLVKRLKLLDRPVEIRRFDVLANDIANIAAREAGAADTSSRCDPTVRWIPSVWLKAFSSDRAGTCSCFPRRNGQELHSIASSSHGTATANRLAPWPKACRFCRRRRRLRSRS